ncbi:MULTISPECIES: TPM domain-containing protein [Niastella]|uniref:TPM domain-containing protein n=1 Tax=Niastella soli TaxID=2821487 RepID=A0ABS3YM09_9BACT|nr:TPM domain-containing protein [Niastella soli]MBO9198627.1 TPM domain-containing protein [Niastella soli]
MIKKLKLFLLPALCFISFFASAQEIPARPNPPRLVNDYAGVLSPDEEQRLERQLVALDDSTSNQVAIVLVKTINDYPIEEYALKLFRSWGIGNAKTNNGVLIIAALDDRKIKIEVGYGLEGAIPDITAGHIIQNDIAPNFRSGDYYQGLSQAANSIIKAAAGEYKAPANYRKKKGSGGLPIGLIIFIIILVVVFSGRNRGGGGGMMSRRGSGWLGPFILGNMLGGSSRGSDWSGGGGGWSGGGGGGFGGFGGGSSGGGGASGSW